MASISKSANISVQGSLFPVLEESNFSDTILLGIEHFRSKPELAELISKDQDRHGLEKKQIREADAKFERDKLLANQPELLSDNQDSQLQEPTKLLRTKSRMDPEVVFIFVLVRAYLGGIKAERHAMFIKDSKFLDALLRQYGHSKCPATSTILDQLNLLSMETTEALIKSTVQLASQEFDIKKIYFDSTRIAADSAWPTESQTIMKLIQRARNGFLLLREQDINVNLPSYVDQEIDDIKSAAKSIALGMGKKDAIKKRKELYREISKSGSKLIRALNDAQSRIESKARHLKPSLKLWAESISEYIQVDLSNAELCIQNAKTRVLKGEKVPNESKVLSLSDPDAEMISKGSKPTIFGYKPQVARSERGFIVGLIVPQGASSDQSMGLPIAEQAIANTGVIPKAVSFDDGYTDSKLLEALKELSIEQVSFSGAKGKKLLPEEDYQSRTFQKLRNERSWVESTMAILKDFFDLHRFHRRGLEAVTQEIQAVACFHNLSLIAKLRKKKLKAQAA